MQCSQLQRFGYRTFIIKQIIGDGRLTFSELKGRARGSRKNKLKPQHSRASSVKNALKTAPMLEFQLTRMDI